MTDVILENAVFRLTVGDDCIVKSLLLKENGEECLKADEEIALFSVTQDRPFNNEVKLAHPNKRTTYQGASLRYEDGVLFVSFEVVPVKARIRADVKERYIAFTLEGFDVLPGDYGHLCMKLPPVAELRLCQLPVKDEGHRKNFGEWLNVVWDDRAAVNVLAASPHARIECERRRDCRVLTADAVRDIRLEGTSAVLIAAKPEKLLDAIGDMERDYGLPDGVGSRRGDLINASVYWTSDINPENADAHIARALQGGFRLMLIYYTAMFSESGGYGLCGNYDYRETYPNGKEDLIALLAKIKAAGITPGLHFLQTHIGMKSRYVTPHADRRLGTTRRFTLSRPLEDGDTELYVDQDPAGTVLHPKCRFLHFGGELIGYEDYTAERPYRFTGITRGAFGTEPEAHPAGQIGGILDISEYGGSSCYIDQTTDLQDEVAEKIADAYNCGFRFCYMDGSEGTNAPYEYHVPNAQYRVYRRFREKPLFTEGAAKAHFSWHFQAGGNAFDVWPPKVFKKTIAQYPAREAPLMRMDFTRLDFGWWRYYIPREEDNGSQADMFEYGTSRAAAWDCPVTIQVNLRSFDAHPRTRDLLEVMRRWEEVRRTGWLTEEQKIMLRDLNKEHTLLIAEDGSFELAEVTRTAAPKDVSAFLFERKGETWCVYWHERGEAKLRLPLKPEDFKLYDEIGGAPRSVEASGDGCVIPADDKRYIRASVSREVLAEAFAHAAEE